MFNVIVVPEHTCYGIGSIQLIETCVMPQDMLYHDYMYHINLKRMYILKLSLSHCVNINSIKMLTMFLRFSVVAPNIVLSFFKPEILWFRSSIAVHHGDGTVICCQTKMRESNPVARHSAKFYLLSRI